MPPQTSFPEVCRHSSSLVYLSAAVIACGPTRTAASNPLTPPALLVSFTVALVCIHLINANIIVHKTPMIQSLNRGIPRDTGSNAIFTGIRIVLYSPLSTVLILFLYLPGLWNSSGDEFRYTPHLLLEGLQPLVTCNNLMTLYEVLSTFQK